LVVEGTLNGSIVVNKTDGKFKLVLNGVQITANSGPAINLQTEKRVFVVIEDHTVNNLTDASEHPLMPNGSKTKAALFSEEQLIISGHGELNITALYQHGIASDDYIKILSGKINILSAVADGLRANDYIVIDGGIISINASGDGIEVERGHIVVNGGKIDITAEKHGIKALYDLPSLTIKPFIDINHGVIHITSMNQGVTSNKDVNLNDGALIVSSVGDAISAAKEITIRNGMYYLTSSEKQPLDGTQGVNIMGGTVILVSQGDEPSIKSNDGSIIFNGGTIVAVGAIDVVVTESSQGYLKYGNVIKNEILHIQGESMLMTIAFLESYNHVIVSSAQMTSGDAYEIYTGGTIQGDNFYGLYFEGTYENGTRKKTIDAN
jgi:hypothetical protein